MTSTNDHTALHVSRRGFIIGGTGAVIAASAFPAWAARADDPYEGPGGIFAAPPFSFTYDGDPSSTLLSTWTRTDSTDTSVSGQTTHTATWNEGTGGLVVRWIVTEFDGYANLRWHVEFEWTGTTGTSPTLADVLALDLTVEGASGSGWQIHTGTGSHQNIRDFEPLSVGLADATHRLFTTHQGRATSFEVLPDTSGSFIKNGWPYFSVDWGTTGIIAAVGWQGQWAFEAARSGTDVVLRAGQVQLDEGNNGDHIDDLELIEAYLLPGETIRTPMVVVQPWSSAGGWQAAQNLWRRWMLDCHMTRTSAGFVPPMLSGTQYTFYATETDQTDWIDAFVAGDATVSEGGRFDHWWVDAGWYSSANDTSSLSWTRVGTWTVNSTRYPNGLAPVVDAARDAGMSFILWFEPERARTDSELGVNHSGWLLAPPSGYQSFLRQNAPSLQLEADDRLLNFGDDDAREWITDRVNQILDDAGVNVIAGDVPGFYREDSNIDPLVYWSHNDPSGRRGITQAKHVAGHLQYWRDILAANPDLLIDTCASGGRRLDVETLSLSVPLLRSDLVRPQRAEQCHTYGLAYWLPTYGTQSPANTASEDGYTMRSAFTPLFCYPVNPEDATLDWADVDRVTEEWEDVRDHYYGDYYPLTTYSSDDTGWMAWEFVERDASRGVVQVFRRDADVTDIDSETFTLKGLNAGSSYSVRQYAGSANTWDAEAGFSSTPDIWTYYVKRASDGVVFTPSWKPAYTGWVVPGETSPGYQQAAFYHADNVYGMGRSFTVPMSGNLTVTGELYKHNTTGGDGVVARVLKNGSVIWSQSIGGTDGTHYHLDGATALTSIAVLATDVISFEVMPVSTNFDYDGVWWRPAVRLAVDPQHNGLYITSVSGASLMSTGLTVTTRGRSATSFVIEEL